METEFTKGNWVVTQTERVECNNEIVALIYDGTSAPTACENINFVTANANLVSAAPDMFYSIVKLQEWSKKYPPCRIYSYVEASMIEMELNEIVEDQLKAIQKAVGSEFPDASCVIEQI